MKKTKGFGLVGIIIIMIITAVVSSIATGVIMLNSISIDIDGNEISLTEDKELLEFIKVYETLVSKYYNNVNKEEMLEAAEDGMIDYLGDKYTTHLEDDEYQEILNELSGTYKGIGITIQGNKIIAVTENSPAAKEGLLKDDVILTIDNVDVQNMDSETIGKLIKNENSKTVNLQINRKGTTLSFIVNKEELPTISYYILKNTKIGYLFIKNFSKDLSSQVSKALNELEKIGIESLIIDVRDNVGGYLSSAEETSKLFLEKGKTIYSLETSTNTYTYKDDTNEKKDYPIVVLINQNTASAAEILSATLKDSYNATLVGAKSYGKGVVQQVISLDSGDSVKVTTAKWLTPNGECIDNIGIYPDYNIEYTNSSEYDSQMLKAIEILSN